MLIDVGLIRTNKWAIWLNVYTIAHRAIDPGTCKRDEISDETNKFQRKNRANTRGSRLDFLLKHFLSKKIKIDLLLLFECIQSSLATCSIAFQSVLKQKWSVNWLWVSASGANDVVPLSRLALSLAWQQQQDKKRPNTRALQKNKQTFNRPCSV